MNNKLRQLATNLRIEKRMSYSEIRNKLGVSKSTLSYWLQEMPLSEDEIKRLQRIGWKKSEAGRERYRNTMMMKRRNEDDKVYQKYCRQFKNISKDVLFVAGLI